MFINLQTTSEHYKSRMQELLEKEGILVKEDQVQNFSKVVWDPMLELRLD